MSMLRPSQREANQLREIQIIRQFTKHAEGAVLVCFGDTRVLCTASIVPGVPRFIKEQNQSTGQKQGWLTAEYGMLPRATHERTEREATRGKQAGRTLEIQRLIGRSLRHCVNLSDIGEYTITLDCDVLQADGGTRTAAITGGCVALVDALGTLRNRADKNPFAGLIAAVSVGMYQGEPILDLDYREDSAAETDMNVVMNEAGAFIEVQGTAEKTAFQQSALGAMLDLAAQGIRQLQSKQREVLGF